MKKKEIIKKIISSRFDLKEHIKELKEDIPPLLIYTPSENAKVYGFISQCVKLFDYIKENNKEKIGNIEKFVKQRAEGIWDKNLDVIKQQRDNLIKIQQEPLIETNDLETRHRLINLLTSILHCILYLT